MEALDQFNKRRRQQHEMARRWPSGPKHNEIACPICGAELYDTNPMTTLASNPPQKNVHCDCGYTGYRVA